MSARRTRANVVDHKDVQLAFHKGGVAEVSKLYSDKKASKATVRRAVRELQKEVSEERSAPLVAWYVKNVGKLGRGASAPVPGETRPLKIQQLKGDQPFIRLTLPGATKGEYASAKYAESSIAVDY